MPKNMAIKFLDSAQNSCGFGGMGDRFDPIKPPSKLANISMV